MTTATMIYCVGCQTNVTASPVMGAHIYPHRPDLKGVHLFQCTACGNHVGCHQRGKYKGQPLGIIPTPSLRKARQRLHTYMDPIWKSGRMTRDELYAQLTIALGREYHTADLCSLEEVDRINNAITDLRTSLGMDWRT